LNRLALLPLLFAPAAWSQAPSADPDPAPEVRWEPFEGRYRTRTGHESLPGRLGRITVPMDRSRPEGPTIELAFVLFDLYAKTPNATFHAFHPRFLVEQSLAICAYEGVQPQLRPDFLRRAWAHMVTQTAS